jgi:hypothetical protein
MIKLSITSCAKGTLALDPHQRIPSALEAKLRRGIRLPHPLFDKRTRESAEAAPKAVGAKSQQHVHPHQTPRHPL